MVILRNDVLGCVGMPILLGIATKLITEQQQMATSRGFRWLTGDETPYRPPCYARPFFKNIVVEKFPIKMFSKSNE